MPIAGPLNHCDASLRIARSRWLRAVHCEDRAAEQAHMHRLNSLLEQRSMTMALVAAAAAMSLSS